MKGYDQITKPDSVPHDHFGGAAPVWLKQQTINLRRGQIVHARLVLRDATGNPIDISDCADSGEGSSVSGDGPRILGRFCETITKASDAVISVDGELVDAENGVVQVTLPTTITHVPGIYQGEIAAIVGDDDEAVITSQQLCIWVEGGLFGGAPHASEGPPRLNDIRMFLRDFAQENELLDAVDFDASEISLALTMPVQDWNEMLPPIRKTYTTMNFPWRNQWTQATVGYLYQIAAEHYARNQLTYQAGGNNIDDKNKAPYYMKASQERLQAWRQFAQSRKVSENASRATGRLGSGYSRIAGGI